MLCGRPFLKSSATLQRHTLETRAPAFRHQLDLLVKHQYSTVSGILASQYTQRVSFKLILITFIPSLLGRRALGKRQRICDHINLNR